jgi:hypothetical protein
MKAKMTSWIFIGAAVVALAVAGCARQGGAHFGEPFTDAPQAAIAQLIQTPEAFARKAVRVAGVIERQCPASGCWFFLGDGQGQSIKVELGDYLPKLPQNIGNWAEVEGEWIKKGEHHEFIGTRVTFSPPPRGREGESKK